MSIKNLMNRGCLCQCGDKSIFQECALQPLSHSQSFTPLLICFQIPTPCSGNYIRKRSQTKFAYNLSKRFYHRRVHSYSWGHRQAGTLIGPIKAQIPPMWSELTAIGWLFISSQISVDLTANIYRYLWWLRSQSWKWFERRSSWSKQHSVSLVWSASLSF